VGIYQTKVCHVPQGHNPNISVVTTPNSIFSSYLSLLFQNTCLSPAASSENYCNLWYYEYSTYGGEERCIQGFGGGPLGRPGHRWEDIKMNFQEVGWAGWGDGLD
jgi:hypothetical protein